jgi:transcriptional regulator with XRE-family HTH domain
MDREKLIAARDKQLWSIEEAAERIGVHSTTLSRWERGEITPHSSSIRKICRAYKTTPEALGLSRHSVSWNQPIDDEHPGEDEAQIAESVKSIHICYQNDVELRIQCLLAEALHRKKSAEGYADLRRRLHQELESSQSMHQQNHEGIDEGRRDAIRRLALFPAQVLGLTALGTALTWGAEEILISCASGLTACEYLSRGDQQDISLALDMLSAYLPTLKTIVRESSQHRQEAARQVAQGSLIKATLAVHREGAADAIQYAQQSLIYARESGDIAWQAGIARRLSWMYFCNGQEDLALETALQAEYLMKEAKVPFALATQSAIYGGIAKYQALNGHKDEALITFGRARDLFSASLNDNNGFVYGEYNLSTLTMEEGLMHLYAGEYDEAFTTLSRVVDVQGETFAPTVPMSSKRVYVEIINNLMLASLNRAVKDKKLSLGLLKAGIAGTTGLDSKQRLSELRLAYRIMLGIWSNEPDVRELRGQLLH